VDFFSAVIGNLVGIAAFCLLVAGVMKLFQIATTLNEIKESLKGLRRDTSFDAPPSAKAAASGQPSGEEMLRALDRELHLDEQPPVIDPEIVNPR
jgi:hypothetical protein